MQYTIEKLDQEFSSVLINSAGYRTDQRNSLNYYKYSAFWGGGDGEPKRRNPVQANWLKAFAEKNKNYIGQFPIIKVPPKGNDEESRLHCGLIEKIVYGTHEANRSKVRQKQFAFDMTLMSEAVAVTQFNTATREVEIRRFDPRICYWKWTNTMEPVVSAFFVAQPMTKAQIESSFPSADTSSLSESAVLAHSDGSYVPVDGQEYFWVIGRWDSKVRCWWVGNQWLEKPHDHLCPYFPVDRCAPLLTGNEDMTGGFFLTPLVELQAEYNETLSRKSAIVKKMGNPTVWAKGVLKEQMTEIRKAMRGDGGFFGLKGNGEVGILQLPETVLFDQHLDRLEKAMKDISGFNDAAFGNPVGANTSADAVAMYYQPTTQAVADQWISISDFYESINAKILMAYEAFGLSTEQFNLWGSRPRGTVESVMVEGQAKLRYSKDYAVTFTSRDIQGYYRSQAITPNLLPKDDIASKRLYMEAANSRFVPFIEAYEEWGLIDPQDTLDQLEQQQANPVLNPQGFQQVAQGLAAQQDPNALPPDPSLAPPPPPPLGV